jgi:hypothetical protein
VSEHFRALRASRIEGEGSVVSGVQTKLEGLLLMYLRGLSDPAPQVGFFGWYETQPNPRARFWIHSFFFLTHPDLQPSVLFFLPQPSPYLLPTFPFLSLSPPFSRSQFLLLLSLGPLHFSFFGFPSFFVSSFCFLFCVALFEIFVASLFFVFWFFFNFVCVFEVFVVSFFFFLFSVFVCLF